jgi:DNA-directed RNA polymerase subunit M/transcription elongation factor TFIIS
MELVRKSGRDALQCVLAIQKNIEIIETNVNKMTDGDIDEYNRVILQVVGDIINKRNITLILKDIKNGYIGWKHHSFDDAVMRLEEQDDFIEHPFQVEEGVLECKCGSKKVYSFSKQTRSADEPMTTYAQCVNCNSTWTYSG